MTSPTTKEDISKDWLYRTRKKCWAIRNRVYPEHERPHRLFDDKVMALASEKAVLLEIGCGRNADWLQRMGTSFRVGIGIDLEIAPKVPPSSGCLLLVGDAHAIPLASGTVDVIACQDSLEHFSNPAQFFEECARVLRPGGWLLVSTVNKFFYPVLAGRMFPFGLRKRINGFVSGTADEDTFPAFYRANSRRALHHLSLRAGLRPVSIRYVSCHPTYLIFSTIVYRLGVAFERFTSRHERLGFLRHLIHGIFELPRDTVENVLRT